MFTRLKLVNFQVHRLLVVDLDPLVTTIVGSSDSGKSAVVRALGLVCLNRPSGEAFVTTGEDHTLVRLDFDSDRKVVRKRGSGVNLYRLDGAEYKAFGADVPGPVLEALNVGDVNFQNQLDAPFWFAASSGEVSRRLNEIINLGAIDRTISHVATEVRKARSVCDVTKQRLDTAREQKEQLAWVPDFDADLSDLEAADARVRKIEAQRGSLRDLLSSAAELRKKEEKRREATAEGKKAVALGDRLAALTAKRADLDKSLKELRRLDKIVSRPIPDDFGKVLALRAEADQVAGKRADLENILDQLHQAQEKQWQVNEQLALARHTLAKLEEAELQATRTCPTCGQPVARGSLSRSPQGTSTSTLKRPPPEGKPNGGKFRSGTAPSSDPF